MSYLHYIAPRKTSGKGIGKKLYDAVNAKMIQKNGNQNRNDFSWTYLRVSLFRVLAKQGDFDVPQPARMCRLICTFPVAPNVISFSCDDKHLLLYPELQ